MLPRVSIVQAYQQQLAEQGFTADAAQLRAAERLEQCAEEWADYKAKRGGTLKKMISKPALPRGVYLWGGVGRGKSMLMDCFFQHVPLERKVRLHFHEFMRATHREMHELRGTENPLDEVAQRVARRYRLICFDEFHVSDIADAMILERLLGALFDSRVGFIMTSNYHPDDLYPDGLHRDRVLPAIALLKDRLDIVKVDGGIDYRRLARGQFRAYIMPLNAETDHEIKVIFDRLASTQRKQFADLAISTEPVLQIESREIRALERCGRVIWFDFATLCGGPRSQNDYLELTQHFDAVLLSGVPVMSAAMSSEARRFTWLVDVLYDHKVKLIISAEAEAEKLYVQGVLANEFSRTVSRLTEMQSEDYLASAQRDVQSRF
ncbi:MAG: AFG1 family ATPase [Betaproteobacteria bacterium]|nr:AFG1 family ATPase [Betaproteobacteria bacterium]